MKFSKQLCLLSLVIFAAFIYAGDIDVVQADRNGVNLSWSLDSYEVYDSGEYSIVQFPGGSGLYQVGSPQIPSQQAFVEVPKGAKINISVNSQQQETVKLNNPLLPAQEPVIDTIGAEEVLKKRFVKNQQAYQSSELFPAKAVEVAYDGIMRGRRLALIRFNPVQYRASTQEITIHKNLTVSISFEGATQGLANTDAAMDYIAKGLVKNFQPAKIKDRAGIKCLILTVPELKQDAEKIALWKNQKGVAAKVTVLGRGVNDKEVKDVIRAHYPEISYALIVGDHPQIPLSKSSARHPLGEENCKLLGLEDASVPSDLFYACVDGDDYYPDIHVGRIPAGNAQEAELLIGKILKHQKNPTSGPWMKRFLLCGEFQYQYSQKNMAERLFCETAFTIHNSLKDIYEFPERTIGTGFSGLNHTQYFFRKAKNPNQPDRPGTYRSRIRDGEGPVQNCQMPSSWTKNIVSNSEATNNTLSFWEKGAFLVQHRDHGSYTSWGKPAVKSHDVASLKNGDKQPILFSINCLTGGMDQYRDCFVEAALKNPNGGAAAAIGSTRVSYSWWNDRLCDGFYTCLFGTDVYDCLDTGIKLPQKHSFSRKLGEVLNFGKMYLALNYPSNPWGTAYDYTEVEFYLFHCIGDPEMQIWTQVPAPLNVSWQDTRAGLEVAVQKQQDRSSVSEATVCLYRDTLEQPIVLTTDEAGKCVFPENLQGEFTLTVTGENIYPFQTTITLE